MWSDTSDLGLVRECPVFRVKCSMAFCLSFLFSALLLGGLAGRTPTSRLGGGRKPRLNHSSHGWARAIVGAADNPRGGPHRRLGSRRQPLGPWAMSRSQRGRSGWITCHGFGPVAGRDRHRGFLRVFGWRNPLTLLGMSPCPAARNQRPTHSCTGQRRTGTSKSPEVAGRAGSQSRCSCGPGSTAAGRRCTAPPATGIATRWQRLTTRH